MNKKTIKIRSALLSVSDKEGIVDFAKALTALDVNIISTGGTCRLLKENNIAAREVSSVTDFPEIMDGRVKTLHPKIHGGILGLRDAHKMVAKDNEIEWLDLVVCNLYPFAKTVKKPQVLFDDAVENIDIGGPTMVRAAAKNMGWAVVIVDPSDYQLVLDNLNEGGVDYKTRKSLAVKAFQHTAHYDAMIGEYLHYDQLNEDLVSLRDSLDIPHSSSSTLNDEPDIVSIEKHFDEEGINHRLNRWPQELTLGYEKCFEPRYGENPHQKACVYKQAQDNSPNILNATIHQGKLLSYNNIVDAEAALNCVIEFDAPACVIVKHANPCGVACGDNLLDAYDKALACDSRSAFGGVVAFNKLVTRSMAEKLSDMFLEIVIAPEFSQEALNMFSKKKNLRVLELGGLPTSQQFLKYKSIRGGMLVQENDYQGLTESDLNIVSKNRPTQEQKQSLVFAWKVLKHVKSNAILIAHKQQTVGVGTGQVSRIDAVDLAIKKSNPGILHEAVLASDAFFPFRDSIDAIAASGIKTIIQPSGAMREKEIIEACDEHGIVLILTDKRSFNH